MSSSSSLTTGRSRKRSVSKGEGDIESPPLRRARRDVLSCELETIQAELEHERSLRALDSKRFVQTKQRLEKQMEFAIEEAKDSKVLMEEMRDENERHLDQLKRAMSRTKAELREVQEDLDEARAISSRKALDEDPRIEMLEEDIDAKEIENDALKGTIGKLQSEMKIMIKQQSADSNNNNSNRDEEDESSMMSPGALSEARPDVLKELNRVRILFAESDRKNRQYKKIAEDAQRKTKQFIQEKEQVRSVNKRVEQLETDLLESTRAEETISEKLKDWQELGVAMSSVLAPSDRPSNPPEITVLRQYLNDAKTKATESENNQITMKKQLGKNKESIQTLMSESTKFERKESVWKEERQEWERRKDLNMKEIKVLKGQEDIYKREVESLRSIVKTFDELPLTEAQGMKNSEPAIVGGASPANIRVLEVSLTAVKEEIEVLKEAKRSLQDDLDCSVAEKEELQKKHNTVLEKFGKLRDALYAERTKAEQATERANEAEILAGKGSFNPEQTRVLHMGSNPLTVALKEEINVLRRQIEVISNGDKQKNKGCPSDVDPNKLHQRLKQSFKEQISRFREGVYLITGYKVDMIPDNDRYKFKVRSVFAEREKDHLVFQWPEGNHVTSLDLLNTEHAKILTKTPSYEYMTKFHSLPAFMASVQLSLFENQTMI